MELSRKILKDFAKIIDDTSKSREKETSINGTAKIENSKKYVKLDGADILTPISEATDIQDGDRVLVSIKNHTATVIGNYTCPASARTASNFLNLTEEGLLIGPLDDNGNIKGTGSLIAPGTYYIVDEKGRRLSSFSANVIGLGDTQAVVNFCGGKSKIYSNEEGGVALEAEEGIVLSAPICTVNGSEIVTADKLIMSGQVTATGSINANSSVTISTPVQLKPGYILAGVREVRSNYNAACVITSFYTHPATNQVGVKLKNTANKAYSDLTVYIEWFALYSDGFSYTVEDVVTFGEQIEQQTETEGGET